MLESLTIRQIALIDEARISFHQGLQVLTGETGAGKSIVVDAMNLTLGERADRELIRSGAEKASVEALFDMSGDRKVRAFLEQEGIEYDGSTVTVYREMTASGKNICRICGVILPLSKLREFSSLLLDLHGQNEHQFLNDAEKQLAFLDQIGDEAHQQLLQATKEHCERFLSNHRSYAKLMKQNTDREDRIRSLEKDIAELEKAHIEAGEAAQLLEQRKKLAEEEKKDKMITAARDCLTGGEGDDEGINRIKGAAGKLKALADQYPEYSEISEKCDSLYYELEEIAYQLGQMGDQRRFDPEDLEKTDYRLDLIHRLERKYSTEADKIPSLLQSLRDQYHQLQHLEETIDEMAAEHRKLLSRYRNSARALTESRKRLASEFENRMISELSDLGMGNTRFCVAFKANDTGKPLMPTDTGDDRIEFMISANPGEPLKPLAKVASGGELSRLMLAVKSLESDRTGVPSMIFDEIDTGISGRMAQAVAEKMIAISRNKQVICVTHLPQIAAAADYHFLVQKSVAGERSNTSVTELDRKGRIGEVSRMISGADGVTTESDAYASRMILAAEEKKKNAERCP